MVTKKVVKIPIYEYTLKVFIWDNEEEVPEGVRCRGAVQFYSGVPKADVYILSQCGTSIVHEAEHVKNEIFRYIGQKPNSDNDEVDAYLIQYIYEKITDIFYLHLYANEF